MLEIILGFQKLFDTDLLFFSLYELIIRDTKGYKGRWVKRIIEIVKGDRRTLQHSGNVSPTKSAKVRKCLVSSFNCCAH